MNLNQKLAQYVLDIGTYSFGISEEWKLDSMTFFIDEIKQKFGIFEKEIKDFVELLAENNIINHVSYVQAHTINPKFSGYAYECEVSIPRLKEFINQEKASNNLITQHSRVKIEHVRLDDKNYLLEINNGSKIMSFKSKKHGEEFEKETKLFKILFYLWEFRWEVKDGEVSKKGDYSSLSNLMRGSGCKSVGATSKQILRLNKRFDKAGVAMEIKCENEKCRLIINTF